MGTILRAINKTLGVCNYHVANVAKYLAGVLLAIMVVMILSQVFFRYALNDSLAWTEELSKFAMVWIACLVAPWAYREHLNVSIDMFHQALPGVLKRIAEIVITSLVIMISAIFFMQSLRFVQGGLTITAASVPVKLWVFYLCMPFAFGSLVLVGIEKLIEHFTQAIVPYQNLDPQGGK